MNYALIHTVEQQVSRELALDDFEEFSRAGAPVSTRACLRAKRS